MKILGVLGSPRKKGNSEILLNEAFKGAKDAGAETELLRVSDYTIKPCDGCRTCSEKLKCHQDDDMQILYDKLRAADGIIFATPVYFWTIPGYFKTFIDRTFALVYPNAQLANKIGGVIVVAGRTGETQTSSLFYLFFQVHHMFSADYVHGFGLLKGEVKRDVHAMKSSWELGRQVSLMVKQGYRFPEEYDRAIHALVRKKYGVPVSPAMQTPEKP
ncbi:MAG: flavodoxin family protein [Dehalococcoidia bacterium]|nr:flavodoxin family protein [Dehalococcoidia bacterium]